MGLGKRVLVGVPAGIRVRNRNRVRAREKGSDLG